MTLRQLFCKDLVKLELSQISEQLNQMLYNSLNGK